GEDQNHETSFIVKALQAAVDDWCKIQVLNNKLLFIIACAKLDDLVKSRKIRVFVIPACLCVFARRQAKAGIQSFQIGTWALDPGHSLSRP
ncbi:MAG: hypothetical protein JW932_19775, partial [Deltaproteobacteria bacterium]|nr:hypothetical protein [Deltaproteobacteria bacterium]